MKKEKLLFFYEKYRWTLFIFGFLLSLASQRLILYKAQIKAIYVAKGQFSISFALIFISIFTIFLVARIIYKGDGPEAPIDVKEWIEKFRSGYISASDSIFLFFASACEATILFALGIGCFSAISIITQ